MLEKIYENNLAFYEMVKITTYLCNNVTDEYKNDAEKIIDFVGKAYGFEPELIEYAKEEIFNQLAAIQTDEDSETYRSLKREPNKSVDVTNPLLKFKNNALTEILNIDFKATQLKQVWFDYSYPNDYNAKIRYIELSTSSGSGVIDINKTVAIMEYLGIGTEKDEESAIRKFKQCMYWSDIASIKFLEYIAKERKNEEKTKVYSELYSLSSYLNDGITVLPKEEKEKCNPKTAELFVLISSIKHDIIYRFNAQLIDYSFTEIMIDEAVIYHKKLGFINTYNSLRWTDETNSAIEATPKMGFKIGE